MNRIRYVAAAAFASLALACGGESEAPTSGGSEAVAGGGSEAAASGGSGPPSGDALAARGKVVYRNNCSVCHAPDPNQEGGLGPSVAGASIELLTAKVMRSEYPKGYTPKRDSRVMVALPFLEPELPALHAYLKAAAAPGS